MPIYRNKTMIKIFKIIIILYLSAHISSCSHSATSRQKLSFKSEIHAYAVDQFQISLKKGQKLTVLINNKLLDIQLKSPHQQNLNNGEYLIAEQSGIYLINILQSRAKARRGENQAYEAIISISD